MGNNCIIVGMKSNTGCVRSGEKKNLPNRHFNSINNLRLVNNFQITGEDE